MRMLFPRGHSACRERRLWVRPSLLSRLPKKLRQLHLVRHRQNHAVLSRRRLRGAFLHDAVGEFRRSKDFRQLGGKTTERNAGDGFRRHQGRKTPSVPRLQLHLPRSRLGATLCLLPMQGRALSLLRRRLEEAHGLRLRLRRRRRRRRGEGEEENRRSDDRSPSQNLSQLQSRRVEGKWVPAHDVSLRFPVLLRLPPALGGPRLSPNPRLR